MKKLLLALVICFSTTSLLAQSSYVNFNLNAHQPLGVMGSNIDEVPIGISMGYYKISDKAPFTYGVELSLASYNCDEEMINYKGQDVNVHSEDNLVSVHGVMRYTVADVVWSELYGEGRMGVSMFMSNDYPTDCQDTEYEGSVDFHGAAFNVGVGGGILLNPTIFSGFDENSPYRIDFGFSSINGTNATYGASRNEEILAEEQKLTANSFTSYMTYRIGFIVKL